MKIKSIKKPAAKKTVVKKCTKKCATKKCAVKKATTKNVTFTVHADKGKAVCLEPESYLRMLLENNCHAVINPFGSYFLMWPELVRDYLLPFTIETKDLAQQKNL